MTWNKRNKIIDFLWLKFLFFYITKRSNYTVFMPKKKAEVAFRREKNNKNLLLVTAKIWLVMEKKKWNKCFRNLGHKTSIWLTNLQSNWHQHLVYLIFYDVLASLQSQLNRVPHYKRLFFAKSIQLNWKLLPKTKNGKN